MSANSSNQAQKILEPLPTRPSESSTPYVTALAMTGRTALGVLSAFAPITTTFIYLAKQISSNESSFLTISEEEYSYRAERETEGYRLLETPSL